MSLVQATTNAGSRLSLGLTALKAWGSSSSTSVPASDSLAGVDNASAPQMQQQGASASEAQAAGQHPWHSWRLMSSLAPQQAALQEGAPKYMLAVSGRTVTPPRSQSSRLQQVAARACLSDVNTGACPLHLCHQALCPADHRCLQLELANGHLWLAGSVWGPTQATQLWAHCVSVPRQFKQQVAVGTCEVRLRWQSVPCLLELQP